MSKRKNESTELPNKKAKQVNIFDSTQSDFEKRKKQLTRQFNSVDICNNETLASYFNNAIGSVTLIVKATRSGKLTGFVIARPYRDKIMELVLVCAEKGVGAVVIGEYEDYLRQHGFILSTLTAIDTAVDYWTKKGYHHVNPGPVHAVKYDLTEDDKEKWADLNIDKEQRKFIIVDDSNHHHDFKYVDEAWNYDGVRMAKIVDYPAAAYPCARTSRKKGCESFRPGGKRRWLFDGC